jgi:tRNA (guanosine-2'-O-)-methyltransferase
MRTVNADDGDVFRPRGQARREVELARTEPERVVRALAGFLTAARRERIEQVLARRTRRLVLATEGIYDPHNAAAVIRTAEAFGVQTVHVVEGPCGFRSSRKVTQGAHKWVDLAVWSRPEAFALRMRAEGREVLVAAMDGERRLADLTLARPLALVFGNESAGVSPRMRELADGAFSIPMHGFVESLNVSVAAAVAAHALRAGGVGDLDPDDLRVLRARFYLRAVRAGWDIVMRSTD